MIQRLLIRNYALIDQLDIELKEGLTIITGETGAGKSILLGALSLLLGQRADSQVLFAKDKKCIIEGEFNIGSYNLQSFFLDNELDYSAISTIRREIGPDGKSRAFINDTPVNLAQLKELSAQLVDIHSQHETLTLNNSLFQLNFLDAFAAAKGILAEYQLEFHQYHQLRKKLELLKEQEKQAMADFDYFQFQFNELEEAALRENEQEILEQELTTLQNAEEIKSNLNRCLIGLQEGEINVLSQLSELKSYFKNILRYNSRLEEVAERLNSAIIELKDIASETEDIASGISFSPERIEEITARLDTIHRLQQKHRVTTTGELIRLKDEFSDKLLSISSLSDKILEQDKELSIRKEALLKKANELSDRRSKVIKELEELVASLLSEVGMPNAVLKIELLQKQAEQFHLYGIDEIKFLFSANKGVDYKELDKVASGGELSRLMLCLKAIMAEKNAMPTIIFDEIDTGISGDIASKVGRIIEKMAFNHQVIAITHLPQMASKGPFHYFVYKELENGTTRSRIRPLNREERITEIARMLSGEKLTPAALENAKVLLSVNN